MTKHPALQMSKVRQRVWLKEASPEDYFDMLTLLTRLYAKKVYTGKTPYKASSLFVDYQDYLKDQAQKILDEPFINNVPAVSTPIAVEPGEVEEKSTIEKTVDELMDLL